jgi:hypothetical protein
MVFSTTFNIISVISSQLILLLEEIEDPEKTTDLSQVTDKLYHIMLLPYKIYNLKGLLFISILPILSFLC